MNSAEITRLSDAFADGTIDKDSLAALQDALRTDAGSRGEYLRVMRSHHQIRAVLQAISGQADAPRRHPLRGPIIIAAVLAIVVGLAAYVLRPTAVLVTATSGVVTSRTAGWERATAVGDRLEPGTTVRTQTAAVLTLNVDPARMELGPCSEVSVTGKRHLRLDEGSASTTGALDLELADTWLQVHGGATIQAAPWAVLLQLHDGATANLAGMPPGGWARRGHGAAWTIHPRDVMQMVGETHIVARYVAHYRATGRFLIEDAVASASPRWRPTGADFLARARRLGGACEGLAADGNAITFPAAGHDDRRWTLPVGRLTGGLSLRMRHGFRLDLQRPLAADGRPGNSFVMTYGSLMDMPFAGAPATRLSPPIRSQDEDKLTNLELRILPVGRSGDVDLSEFGVWADGRLFLIGWLRGSDLIISTEHRGGRMRIADISVSELWDTQVSTP